MLRQLAVHHAEPVRLLGGDALARGRDAHKLALVGAHHRAPHRHRLPVGGHVLYVEAVVGEDRQYPLPDAPGTAVAVLFGAGGVVDVPRRDEPVYGPEAVPAPDLPDGPPHHGPALAP